MIRFHVLTLFPEMVEHGLGSGIIGRAAQRGIIALDAVNIRDYTLERHGKVDDYPYGGGAGMLMQAQPVYDAHRAASGGRKVRTVCLTPQGAPFTQRMARALAEEEELIFLCGHYEGIDERVLEEVVTDYVSIGDYVLTGGELAAMVMIDAVARLVPGVLGNGASPEEESFSNDLLEYPQYSRPEVWRGRAVPEVLLSGNHRAVAAWRLEQSRRRTAALRPDLYEKYQERQRLIGRLSLHKRDNIHMMESLAAGRGGILYAQDRGKETAVLLYDGDCRIAMMTALDREMGERMADMLPEETDMAVVSEPFLRDLLLERGYTVSCGFGQFLYTRREALPVRHKEIRTFSTEIRTFSTEIRTLSMDDLAYVGRWYRAGGMEGPGAGEGYLRERIRAGELYGAFADGRQVGFAGLHGGGGIGMLFVEEPFRRRGIAASLQAYVANRLLERGRTPYAHVPAGNEASERLQEKLGFYRAEKTFWRMEKGLAIGAGMC